MAKSDHLFAAIEERMATGYYAFGQRISVAELAKTFGASRHPIMTALNKLQTAGLVHVIPQVGCEVVSLSPDQIKDFYLYFGRMEGVMARWAAERHRDDQLDQLVEINATIGNPERRTAVRDSKSFREKNREFHHIIHEMAAAPPAMVASVEALWAMSDFLMASGSQSVLRSRPRAARAQHAGIIAALRSRDGSLSELEMQKHIEDSGHEIARAISQASRSTTVSPSRYPPRVARSI